MVACPCDRYGSGRSRCRRLPGPWACRRARRRRRCLGPVDPVFTGSAAQSVVTGVAQDFVLAGLAVENVQASPPLSPSLPVPPRRMSPPPRPLMVSLPPRPQITSARLVPRSTSFPGVPVIVHAGWWLARTSRPVAASVESVPSRPPPPCVDDVERAVAVEVAHGWEARCLAERVADSGVEPVGVARLGGVRRGGGEPSDDQRSRAGEHRCEVTEASRCAPK